MAYQFAPVVFVPRYAGAAAVRAGRQRGGLVSGVTQAESDLIEERMKHATEMHDLKAKHANPFYYPYHHYFIRPRYVATYSRAPSRSSSRRRSRSKATKKSRSRSRR
jgi:hypothetical protein